MRYFMEVIRTARPSQWSKNLVVFAGVIFARQALDPYSLAKAVFAFICFCLLSSAVYAFNDVVDRDRDRLHPVKRKRPVASGDLPVRAAYIMTFCLAMAGLAISWLISETFLMLAGTFLLLQTAYSLRLKRIVILDVMAISTGFVFRAMAGAVAVRATISHWLLVCTMLLALFLALAKRRSELSQLGTGDHREILSEYNTGLLDMLMAISTSTTLMGYILYTVSPDTIAKFGTDRLVFTTPFVVYGLFRYLYLVYRHDLGEAPSAIFLSDEALIADIVLWMCSVSMILYL